MNGYKHLTQDQQQEILDLFEECPYPDRIAAKVGVTKAQVRYWLKKNDKKLLYLHSSGACASHEQEIRQWVEEGISQSEIARRIGTNRESVRRFLETLNIPYQPYSHKGENNPAWKGGRQIDKDGYVLLWMPEHPRANKHGYVREHRLVMERILGRYLSPKEVVDHVDRDPQNNSPENLVLYATNSEHLRATLTGQKRGQRESQRSLYGKRSRDISIHPE